MATKEEKDVVVAELTERLKASTAVYLTDYTGMTVAQISLLRREFRKVGITFKVYKNSMVKRAMGQIGGYDAVYPSLNEQTAYAFATDPRYRPRFSRRSKKTARSPSSAPPSLMVRYTVRTSLRRSRP